MPSFSYRQTLDGTFNVGWVVYNITPDFGTLVSPGDTITITGQAYFRDSRKKSIEVSTAAGNEVRHSVLNVVMAKGATVDFTISFRMWTLGSEWGATRVFDAPILFTLWSGANMTGTADALAPPAGAAQNIHYLSYRISPLLRRVEFERYALSGSAYAKNDEGTALMGQLAIRLASGRDENDITVRTVTIEDDAGGSQTITLTDALLADALTVAGYVESSPGLFSGVTFNTAYNYTLTFTIGDSYDTIEFSVLIARAFANIHLSGARTGGVAFGKFSAATDNNPLFECAYPAVFSAGITGVTNESTSEVATGGHWIDGKPFYRKTFYFGPGSPSGQSVTIDSGGIGVAFIRDAVINSRSGGNGDYWTGNYYIAANDYFQAYVDNGKITYRFGSTISVYRGVWIIVEYTKATD